MSVKKNISIVSKVGLSLVALAVVTSIVPNSQLVFGYGSSSSDTTDHNSAGTAPACTDGKPGSAPGLSVVSSGANSVTLSWTKANDPVSYYLLTFGTHPGEQAYGNPNVGGSDTTSYTVNGLSGGTRYYFRLRAGDGCMPGDYSNEVSGVPNGGFVSTIPAGFAAGVLGETTQRPVASPSTTPTVAPSAVEPATPTAQEEVNTGSIEHLSFWQRLIRFIKSLFGRG